MKITTLLLAALAAFSTLADDVAATTEEGKPTLADELGKRLSLLAYADVESAYICRGYVWDKRPYSAQAIEGSIDMNPFGRFDAYVWTMSAMSSSGHSTPMRYAYNEIDYGMRYFYDLNLADDWTLANGVARQWVTNPGVRHGGHSFIDWWAMQTLKNPYIWPYWRMRYSRRPFQATYWCLGLKRPFQILDDLTLTVDAFGDLGDSRTLGKLFGPKPNAPKSTYRPGLFALNLVLRLDYRLTDHVGLFAFVGQYDIVRDDVRDALRASPLREATRDLTYGGVGFSVGF